MLNFERLHQVIYEELGECGYEAIQSAIEAFLGNCPSSGCCEEDKLILLMYLYSGQPSTIFDQYNPVLHFQISFDCEKSFAQEAAE